MHRRITAIGIVKTVVAAALVATGLAAAAPTNSIRPALTGSLRVGQELKADVGTWAGSQNLAYAYVWYRCDNSAAKCKAVAGAKKETFTLTAADAGKTIGLTVRASDSSGSANAYSSVAGPIATGTIYATAAPKISGTAEAGQELKVDGGSWAVTPRSLAYQWLRCNGNGRVCAPITGASTQTYKAVSDDVGRALVAVVAAKVGTTVQPAFSAATAPIAAEGESLPAGATPLGTGKYSIPVTSVELPARLVVAGATLVKPSSLKVRVADTRGHAVRGALVAVTAPYGWVARVKEAQTGTDGTVTFRLAAKPGHPRAIVLYVRARKAGDDVLAGVTATRLVSVRPAS